jgi:hypothetical protein
MRQIVDPCIALVGRLLDLSPTDDMTILRALVILGQVTVFCNEGARRALGWTDFNAERLRAIQALLREQTRAIFGGING